MTTIDDPLLAEADDLQDAGALGNVERGCPVVRVEYGVFFDGTGNNETNYLSGIDMRAKGQVTSGSYDNEASNIAKLFNEYKNEEDAARERNQDGSPCVVYDSFYVDGIGTTAGRGDSNIGFATGLGRTGVNQRVARTIEHISMRLAQISAEIDEVILDVFGFSRGAAAARHFVNLLHDIRNLDVGARRPGSFYSPLFTHEKLRIRFVGLFDCVVSTGTVADDDNYAGSAIGLTDDIAEKVVNIFAGDEFRLNFSANSILARPNRLTGGVEGTREEYIGPGAHSDLGGGYSAHFPEAPIIALEAGRGPTLASPQDMIQHLETAGELSPADIERKQRLVEKGWCLPGEIDNCYIKQPISDDWGYHIILDRSAFHDHRLARVYLHVMHQLALDNDAGLRSALPSGPLYDVPGDLGFLKNKVLNRQPLTRSETVLVRRMYTHHSAHFAISDTLIGTALELRPMIPQNGTIRTIYPNDPNN
ncbi:T6SS phospholipase effector Tle1-like catalytic domain-containing protein [Jannaschia pohangensis]|uniref:Uncharacterized alpha/beta hydrolase domain n=1 Tax=Jannaschia pohangensis TaxID=390807 RepID=A0A1I3M7Q2_9RHOB|nr:DUF2235 domain-containing protein [Jannaschia pohangensis]SFI92726.1 Uncharacterized alpha/beta hydrolase domain [Jannaschia pohangensis]